MNQIIPYSNIVAAVFVFLVGFCFHWIGQLISLLDWNLATRLGLQERDMLAEYRDYEQAIAVADVSLGWIYGVVAVGLALDAEWGYRLAWIPASVLFYHSVSAWFWERNRRAAGHRLWSDSMRIGWCGLNLSTAILCLYMALSGSAG